MPSSASASLAWSLLRHEGALPAAATPRSCRWTISTCTTGDFRAITTAHNLLSAMIDNHIYWGNELGIDAPRRLAAGARHERSGAARDRLLVGRRRQWLSPRGRVRHHGRLGDHGHSLPCDLARGSRAASVADRRRRPPRQEPAPRQGSEGARRHDRAAQGCADAEPGADAGEQSGLCPRRRSPTSPMAAIR